MHRMPCGHRQPHPRQLECGCVHLMLARELRCGKWHCYLPRLRGWQVPGRTWPDGVQWSRRNDLPNQRAAPALCSFLAGRSASYRFSARSPRIRPCLPIAWCAACPRIYRCQSRRRRLAFRVSLSACIPGHFCTAGATTPLRIATWAPHPGLSHALLSSLAFHMRYATQQNPSWQKTAHRKGQC